MNIKAIINEEINRFLNESSIKSIEYDDIITPQYIKDIEFSDNYERFIELYKYEEGLEDIDDDEISETDEFKKWLTYELQDRFDNVIDKLWNVIKNDNTIDIWRSMTVSEQWVNDLITRGKHLGIYWSWDDKAAEPHWGYGNNNSRIDIGSSIREEYIDWDSTIKLNMDYSLGDDEKEIRLYKNTPLKITELIYDGENILTNEIANKTFYA